MLVRDELWIGGELVSFEMVEVPDPEPTDAEKIAELQATVDQLLALLEG